MNSFILLSSFRKSSIYFLLFELYNSQCRYEILSHNVLDVYSIVSILWLPESCTKAYFSFLRLEYGARLRFSFNSIYLKLLRISISHDKFHSINWDTTNNEHNQKEEKSQKKTDCSRRNQAYNWANINVLYENV